MSPTEMAEQLTGTLFEIQRFCLNDGPGIRTVFFFKGCPLRCAWCHNPESWKMGRQLFYRQAKCTGCGECAAVCPARVHSFPGGAHLVNFEACTRCGRCLATCCYDALELTGRRLTVAEALAETAPDRSYYGSGGGVTFSGGEPMAQPEFALALARALRDEGIGLCIETCGYTQRHNLEDIAPYVDVFLYDFKVADPEKHRRLTGVSNKLILENLAWLDGAGKRIVLRCPLLPGVNDSPAELEAIAAVAGVHPHIEQVELMPYHTLDEVKKDQLGAEESLFTVPKPTGGDKQRWLETLAAAGCQARLG